MLMLMLVEIIMIWMEFKAVGNSNKWCKVRMWIRGYNNTIVILYWATTLATTPNNHHLITIIAVDLILITIIAISSIIKMAINERTEWLVTKYLVV